MIRRSAAMTLAATTVLVAAAALPAGCFFPNYTFDKNTGGAGGTGPGTGPSMGTGGSSQHGGGPQNGGGGAGTGGTEVGGCTCSDSPPTGFTGFFTLYDGDPTGDPGCPSQYPKDETPQNGWGRQLNVPDADCSSYKCSTPTGGTCGALPTTLHVGDAMCGGNENCSAELNLGGSGACFDDSYLPGGVTTCGMQQPMAMMCNTGTKPCNVSLSTAAIDASGGSCATCSGTATLPEARFQKLGRGCGSPVSVTPNSCNPGQTCLPNPSTNYAGICIMQTGDVDCPLGKFGTKHLFYGDKSEGRSCSDCQCDAATGQTCKATITVYTGNTGTCSGTVVATFNVGDCDDGAGINNQQIGDRKITNVATTPSGGSCTHTGGDPMGTVMPTMPTTFCCTE